ncbi:hypothetical protein ANO14919_135440 [Xylariales sp. No.14919]|nr:hypothetical protein ANO14919_135440 [Xylariales sp. No.14919]
MAVGQGLTKPVLLEGDLLDLWKEAQTRFSTGIKSEDGVSLPEWVLKDPGRWPELLKSLCPKGNSQIDLAYDAVGRHIETIQRSIQTTMNIFQLVSAV